MRNRRPYESADLVAVYGALDRLQPSEEEVLRRLGPRLADARLLDLGVGGGRTTVHLHPRVRAYVGVDRSAAMVEACRARFASEPRAEFLLGDARDLSFLGERRFDVVLFSLNGIDGTGRLGRRRVLSEVRRVLAPGGVFAFSSHNLGSLRDLLALRVGRHPLRMPRRALAACRRRRLNGGWERWARRTGGFVRDGSHGWRLANFHVRPRTQVDDLARAGFAPVVVLDRAGREVAAGPALDAARDRWLVYLCGTDAGLGTAGRVEKA